VKHQHEVACCTAIVESPLIVADYSHNHRSLELRLKLRETIPLLDQRIPTITGKPRQPIARIDPFLSIDLIDLDVCNDPFDGLLKIVAESSREKRQMDASFGAVHVDSVGEEVTINWSLGITPTIQVHSYGSFGLPEGDEQQVGEKIEVDHYIQQDGLELSDVVSGASVDDVAEAVIQIHQHLALLLVLQSDVVLLIYVVIALDRLCQGCKIRMFLGHLRSVVPQDEMVFQRTLERLAHHVLNCHYFVLSAQLSLNFFCFGVTFHQIAERVLRACEIFEVLRVHQQKFRILLHGGADLCTVTIPCLEDGIQLTLHFLGQLDHGLNIGEHSLLLILADESLLSQRFLDVVLNSDQIVKVVTLSRNQLVKTVPAISTATGQLLPLRYGQTRLGFQLQLAVDVRFWLYLGLLLVHN
jgi:hypothetical protein